MRNLIFIVKNNFLAPAGIHVNFSDCLNFVTLHLNIIIPSAGFQVPLCNKSQTNWQMRIRSPRMITLNLLAGIGPISPLPGNGSFQKSILLLAFACLSKLVYAQDTDSTKKLAHFSGSVTLTNKGISLVPSFTLGKPAVIFNGSMGKGKLSFDPELRFSLEAKPWTFLFWWRYQLIQNDRFSLRLGTHLGLNYRTFTADINGQPKDRLIANRYLAGELTPSYSVSKKVSIGMYYLLSHGFEEEAIGVTNFLTLNCTVSDIPVTKYFWMRITPQVYYLRTDDQDGFYFGSSLSLSARNFPLSLASIINEPINTSIKGGQDFLWNVSLIYSFSRKYVELR